MKKWAIFALILAARAFAQNGQGQTGNYGVAYTVNAPSGACATQSPIVIVMGPGTVYTCVSGTWTLLASGGGGSVTSFSAGNLSPLFTSSVATPTSTPALTFSLSTAAANTAYGNFTGSTAAPSFTATTGTGSPVAATSPTLVTPALGTPSALVLTNATGLVCAATPALTGDTTTSAGSCATTTAKINGTAFPVSATVIGSNASSQPIAATTTGSGTTVALATSPVFVTPTLGVASATSVAATSFQPSANSTTAFQVIPNAGTVGSNCLIVGDTSNLRINIGSTTCVAPLANPFNVNNNFSVATGGSVSRYNGVATTRGGLPSSVATINVTAQGAAIASAALYTVPNSAPAQGIYCADWAGIVTTAATTSSTLGGTNGFQLNYTDNDTGLAATTPGAGAPAAGTNTAYSQTNQQNTVGSQASGRVCINAKINTAVTYSFGWTSSGATPMAYALHVDFQAHY